MTTAVAFALLLIYALAITLYAYGLRSSSAALNPLCLRDFVEPSGEGTCLCGENRYCLCTPSLAADVIIELEDADGVARSIVFIERKDGRGLALVGGFVKVGESVEAAAAREVLEESASAIELWRVASLQRSDQLGVWMLVGAAGLTVTGLRQWCMFSQPRRDPRRHTAAQVFVGRARGVPKGADDAKGVRLVAISELQRTPPNFAFDHGDIVRAYVARHHSPRRGGRRTRSAVATVVGSATASAGRYDGACAAL